MKPQSWADLFQSRLNGASHQQRSWLVNNAMTLRRDLMNRILDPRRSVDDECGYPTHPVGFEIYQELFDREPIAARVVEVLAKESWQVQPRVFETEDVEVTTPFEQGVKDLGQQMRGEQSYFQDEEGSPVWELLCRADIMCGLGHYGVIYLGIDDGRDPAEPAPGFERFDTSTGPAIPVFNAPPAQRRLLFATVLHEGLAPVSRYETNRANPRYGLPVEYSLTFNDPRDASTVSVGMTQIALNVHWSRVIHLADNITTSRVFGFPRMQQVLNRLYDLRKIYAADGETYWRNAVLKLFFETYPQLGSNPLVDMDGMRDTVEDMLNGLQQWMLLSGMSAKSIAPAVSDPTPHAQSQIEAICIKLGIPKRVFMGSERGELASSQDDAAWNDRLRHRQRNFITPSTIAPFFDRLISLGVLPVPSGYSVWWPDLTSQTQSEKASVAVSKTQALAQYVSGNVQQLMTRVDYLSKIIGMEEDESMQVVESAQAEQDAKKAVEEEMRQKLQAEAQQQQQPGAPPENTPATLPFQPAPTGNAFCPTGPGGGIDASCSPGDSTGSSDAEIELENRRYDEDHERDNKREAEDDKLNEREAKEDAAAEKQRAKDERDDATVDRQRDKEDAQHEKEVAKLDKEEEALGRQREKEDAKIEKQRDKEDIASDKETERIESLDNITEEHRAQLHAENDRKTAEREKQREAEDATREASRAKEDREYDNRREALEKAQQDREAKREAEDKQRQERDARRDKEEEAITIRYQKERERLQAERVKEDERLAAQRAEEDRQLREKQSNAKR